MSDQNQPHQDNKCLSMVKNCLACIFPKLLEGLTHPDQRDSLPIRKKKNQKQEYQRVSNPNEDDDDEDEDDEECKVSTTQIGDRSSTQQPTEEDSNQFFNEFQSWRSSQSSTSGGQGGKSNNNGNSPSKNCANKQTELTELKSQQKKPQTMLTLSENEIELQKNRIMDEGNDDLFKSFQNERKLPPAPSVNRGEQRSKAQLNNLFNDLSNTTSNNGAANQTLSDLPIFQNDVKQADQVQPDDSKKDIMEEKGWDDEININIE